jgi:hypothetical protein
MCAVFYSCVLHLFVQNGESFQFTTMFNLLPVPKLDLVFVQLIMALEKSWLICILQEISFKAKGLQLLYGSNNCKEYSYGKVTVYVSHL